MFLSLDTEYDNNKMIAMGFAFYDEEGELRAIYSCGGDFGPTPDKIQPQKKYMTPAEVDRNIRTILLIVQNGWKMITFDGKKHDLNVILKNTSMPSKVKELFQESIDLSNLVEQKLGKKVSLDALLKALGIQEKEEQEGVDGASVPKLWNDYQHRAVLKYLQRDVVGLLELAYIVAGEGKIAFNGKEVEIEL